MTGWLIARLARGPNNTPLDPLSDTDRVALVAGIRDMHRTVYGVTMFDEHTGTGAPADNCIGECIDRYAAARERFTDAIVLAERTTA